MSVDRDRFLEVEQHANELVDTLENLKREVSSYSNATENLVEIRNHLISLIEQMESVASETSQAARNVRDIGGPQIIERIDNLETLTDGRTENILKETRGCEEAIIKTREDISKRLEPVQDALSQISEHIKRLMVVAYSAIALAALGSILALLGLLN